MWHMTCDTWHVTCDTWHVTGGGRWTFSQNFRSLALLVWDSSGFENICTMHESVATPAGCVKYGVNQMFQQLNHYNAMAPENYPGYFRSILQVSSIFQTKYTPVDLILVSYSCLI